MRTQVPERLREAAREQRVAVSLPVLLLVRALEASLLLPPLVLLMAAAAVVASFTVHKQRG